MKSDVEFYFNLESVFSEIPISFPVLDWVALNPLSDLTKNSFHSAIYQLRKNAKYQGYLNISEYIDLYNSGRIGVVSIQKSCEHHSHLNLTVGQILNIETQKKLENISKARLSGRDQLITTQLGDLGFPDMQDWMENRIFTFLSAWFDEGLAFWRMPSEKTELFEAWKDLTHCENSAWKKQIAHLPDDPIQACSYLLFELGVPTSFFESYIRQITHRILGWMSLIKCKNRYPQQSQLTKTSHLASPIVIWLAQENFYLKKIEKTNNKIKKSFEFREFDFSQDDIQLNQYLQVWQRALEFQEHGALLAALKTEKKQLFFMEKNTDSQWIFCMDPRSHLPRTIIESTLSQETFGVAGFFGFPMRLECEKNKVFSHQAPFLLPPEIILKFNEWFSCGIQSSKESYSWIQSLNLSKSEYLSPYFLFEMTGYCFFWEWMKKAFLFQVETHDRFVCPSSLDFKNQTLFSNLNIEIKTAIEMSYAFLMQCGLSKRFSKHIILCGHRALTVNNPQQASFECGACGGHSGEWNAKIACEILNHEWVRAGLEKKGVLIPEETQFIPALHNTSLQTIQFLIDEEKTPSFLLGQLDELNQSLLREKGKRQQEKFSPLHFAELIPEWGLAGNALLVIGSSICSQFSILQGRCFLQSYCPNQDSDGEILKTILDSVALVAQEINAQYYFSSTDPEIYGGGNKALHNVVSGVGVMEGNLSDLKIGLSTQSLCFRGERIHIPLRLMVVILADQLFVSEVIKRTQFFSQLLKNEWVFLEVIEETE